MLATQVPLSPLPVNCPLQAPWKLEFVVAVLEVPLFEQPTLKVTTAKIVKNIIFFMKLDLKFCLHNMQTNIEL
jgi:hypothetical protein